LRTWIQPNAGAAHAARIAAALASAASMVDSDRSELDEYDVAQRVAEHLRPLDPRGLADIPRGNLDMLAARAEHLRSRAPFAPRVPHARAPREQRLRHYLASFGIEVAPRVDGERERTDAQLVAVLDKLASEKKRPSIVHLWAPAPAKDSQLARAVRRLKGRHVEVRWTLPSFERGFERSVTSRELSQLLSLRDAMDAAVLARARASRARDERALRKLGVRAQARVVR
jgi:hypothetical protein